jgi:hypothetical protein
MANQEAPITSQMEPMAVSLSLGAEDPLSLAGDIIERVREAVQDLQLSNANEILGMIAAPAIDADKLEALSVRLSESGLEELSELVVNAAARIDLQDPQFRQIWGGAFNGQMGRRSIMNKLVTELGIAAVLETGTYRGSSTEYMAERFTIPIYSCEVNPRYYHYSTLRLANKPNVKLSLSDSRLFLKRMLASAELPDGQLLCYLDAHWSEKIVPPGVTPEDLPVWEEINLIFALRPSTVAVVDDFRVPGDRGFQYDDYGRGRCLSVIDLRANVAAEIDMLFPRYPSAAETGARRGMVVLARKDTAERILSLIPDLERLDWRQAVSMDAAVGELSAVANAVADFRNVVERQGDAMQAGIAGLVDRAVSWEAARLDLLEQIRTLRAQIEKSEADRAARLTIIHTLTARLEESEADRAARLTIIHTLTARLEESEADRADLIAQIEKLGRRNLFRRIRNA